MDNYIDERTKEQFTEDTALREAINNIYDMLAEMPKEKRLAFFEQISKPKDLDFVKEIGQKKLLPSIAGLAVTICCKGRATALLIKNQLSASTQKITDFRIPNFLWMTDTQV